jgi:methylenetetrahydrofolate dehydrogenase (NADP+) / methenyltetrahydrofolate cyclohydrolase
MAKMMPGGPVADAVFADLGPRIEKLVANGHVPGLATLLVGDDDASARYVGMKHAKAAELGCHSVDVHLPDDATQSDVLAAVHRLNDDASVDAVLFQYPPPSHIDFESALIELDPDKDVDGLHPVNLGSLVLGQPAPLPCTPTGVLELLRRYDVPIAGAHAVIIGRGITVGRPLGLLLSRRSENATVTLCHTGTRDLPAFTRQADILVSAAGRPNLITPDMVKPGAAVLDVGISRVDGKVAGDVHPDVAEVAGWISPNPGGAGPMTRAMLLRNVVDAAARTAIQ